MYCNIVKTSIPELSHPRINRKNNEIKIIPSFLTTPTKVLKKPCLLPDIDSTWILDFTVSIGNTTTHRHTPAVPPANIKRNGPDIKQLSM